MSKSGVGIYYSELIYFHTDKKEYNHSEIIRINASWNLEYNPSYELAFIQIQIFNISDGLKWNSSRCYEIGTFEKNWSIDVNNINLTYINGSTSIFIKFFSYYVHFDIAEQISLFLKSIEVQVNILSDEYDLNTISVSISG